MPIALPRLDAIAEADRLAENLPALLVNAVQVAATIAPGLHGRRRVGRGDAFWQFRHYQPGDPPITIDWRRSARSDQIYTRQFEWEAVQSVWLWRDSSASMDYTSDTSHPTKRQRADVLLLALAALLIRAGERVSLLGGSMHSGLGRSSLQRIADDLTKSAASGGSVPPPPSLPPHGEVVMIGDFLDPIETIRPVLSGYAERGLTGYLVQVTDMAEETLPFDGRVRFDGLEGEGDTLVRRVSQVRPAYAKRLQAHRLSLGQIAKGLGWFVFGHRTDQPPQPVLLALHQAMSDLHGLRP